MWKSSQGQIKFLYSKKFEVHKNCQEDKLRGQLCSNHANPTVAYSRSGTE